MKFHDAAGGERTEQENGKYTSKVKNSHIKSLKISNFALLKWFKLKL